LNEETPEQTGPEQGGQDPDTPGREAEDVSGSSAEPGSSPEQPQTQEELRARLEEQLRRLRVQDLLVESVVSVLNLTARRIAKEDERDLDQARVGIDAIRAWVDLLPEEAATQIRNALSELQMLYAQAVEGGDAGEKGGGEDPGAGGDAPAGPSQQPPRASEPPPRIWTPPGSN
jgi:hypothetical protein